MAEEEQEKMPVDAEDQEQQSDGEVPDWIAERFPEASVMTDFNDCIIGMCYRFGQEPIVAYSYEKVIAKLMGMGMSREEAIEYHEFNQAGAWVGDTTPCFIELNDDQW